MEAALLALNALYASLDDMDIEAARLAICDEFALSTDEWERVLENSNYPNS